MDKVIIEASINESVTRAQHPGVPITPEEIADQAIACARAGASIIHFHARDRQTGADVWTSFETYADAYRLIQKASDVGGGGGSAAVTYADGRLYFRYETGVLVLIDPSPEGLKVVSSFKLPPPNV